MGLDGKVAVGTFLVRRKHTGLCAPELSTHTIAAAEVPAGFGADFRSAYRGTLIGAGGFDRVLAEAELKKGNLDLIAFGTSYIANPDLVERMRNRWPLAESDRSTFYGVVGAKGFTDYPAFDADKGDAALQEVSVAGTTQCSGETVKRAPQDDTKLRNAC